MIHLPELKEFKGNVLVTDMQSGMHYICSKVFENKCITLVQQIWDSVAADAGLQPPSATERAELERRIAEADAAPGDVTAWETIKAEAQSRR